LSIPCFEGRHKYVDRPAPCWVCGSRSWWDGWRDTASERRHRARCSDRSCPGGSWTVYPADTYPHRGFSLGVVVGAVAAFATGAALASVASEIDTSRWSVARWARWVAMLGDASSLSSLCERIDPTRAPAPRSGGTSVRERAARMLVLLERIAAGYVARGVPLPAGSSGVSRLLAHQLTRFRSVFYLTVRSPPLHADLRSLPP